MGRETAAGAWVDAAGGAYGHRGAAPDGPAPIHCVLASRSADEPRAATSHASRVYCREGQLRACRALARLLCASSGALRRPAFPHRPDRVPASTPIAFPRRRPMAIRRPRVRWGTKRGAGARREGDTLNAGAIPPVMAPGGCSNGCLQAGSVFPHSGAANPSFGRRARSRRRLATEWPPHRSIRWSAGKMWPSRHGASPCCPARPMHRVRPRPRTTTARARRRRCANIGCGVRHCGSGRRTLPLLSRTLVSRHRSSQGTDGRGNVRVTNTRLPADSRSPRSPSLEEPRKALAVRRPRPVRRSRSVRCSAGTDTSVPEY